MKKQLLAPDLLIDYIDEKPSGKKKGIKTNEPKDLRIGDLTFSVQSFENIRPKPGMGIRGISETVIKTKAKLKTRAKGVNPWDLAHHTLKNSKDNTIKFVEPDIIHVNETAHYSALNTDIKKFSKGFGHDSDGYDAEWPSPANESVWHIEGDYSQLKAAREEVLSFKETVRVAHFDTGVVKGHMMLPDDANIRWELQKSFGHDDDDVNNASDRYNPLVNGVGHGTSTLSLLAGKKVKYAKFNFNDYLGGAPWAEIVPVRISRSVVLLRTSSFIEGVNYILGLNTNEKTKCDIITMSMGGLPTKAWADAVNSAYDNGVFMVTASGDNKGGIPTTSTVYPARFRRVVNATGACYDYTPYYHGNIFHTQATQGNFGPEYLMDNAIAAFTPNVPWIVHDKDNNVQLNEIGLNGAGTSSATPQIAAAAANYIRKHYSQFKTLQPWQKVEAIRHALFKTAYKRNVGDNNMKLYFGNGVLKANDALAIEVNPALYTKQPVDEVRFPLFNMLFRAMNNPKETVFIQMIEVEMLQIVSSSSELQKLLEKTRYDFITLTKADKKEVIDLVLNSRKASHTLKEFLHMHYTKITNH